MTVRASSPRKRGPIITAGGYGSRLSLRSAGTTIVWFERSTNLRLYEMTAGAISLLWDCYLQWPAQLQRVGPARGPHVTPDVSPSVITHISPSVVIMCFAFEAPCQLARPI